MTQKEFLQRLREREGFVNAALNKITVGKARRVCLFTVMTDRPYSEEDEAFAKALVREAVPQSMRSGIKICKIAADSQLIVREILRFLQSHHRAAAACIAEEDIEVVSGDPMLFRLGVDDAERGFFEKNEGLKSALEEMLERNFCKKFAGELFYKTKPVRETDDDFDEEDVQADYRPPRTFEIVNFEPIDEGEIPKSATYLADCDFASESLTVCGEIAYLQERVSKAKTDEKGEVVREGKPYLRITISDTTDKLTLSYYPRKKTEEKIRELKEGDKIVCTGRMEWFNERLSFVARYINRGSMPEDFVPEKKQAKAIPSRYSTVQPEKLVDYDQISLFDRGELPKDLVENTFVVFDLETTGLVNSPIGGKMDAITEIGAVKIENGEIREKFTTLVNPERKLTEEIVALTGITDDMLKDAPKIGEVIGDFCKFCEGCLLVGHNVQFDYKFARYYAEQEEYEFEHKTYDTLSIAQGLLFLPNYKLNTLADYYGISFNHHRAWSDAHTTAKIFIELIKAKKCLPKA